MKVEEVLDTLEQASANKFLSEQSIEDINLMATTAALFIQKARLYVQPTAPQPGATPVPQAPKTET